MPGRDVSTYHRQYCEAVLEVRRKTPEARRIFSTIRDQAALTEASATLADQFDQELRRQLRVKSGSGRAFVVATSLIGGGAGWAASFAAGADVEAQVVASLATSVLTGFGTTRADRALSKLRKKKLAPWLLAMDTIEQSISSD